MTKYIGFAVLTANALIHEMESNDKRSITLDYAQKYAKLVTKHLDEKGVEHTIIYDREQFEDCAQDFVVDFSKGVVVACDDVTYDDLRDHYRGMLPYEVLAACVKAEKEIDSDNKNTTEKA